MTTPNTAPIGTGLDLVDSHHHLWRIDDLPWLAGDMVPRIFGPYEPIRRDYLATEYIEEATSNGITSSVYVQANWPLEKSLDEVRWLHDVNAETGWPMAVIGSADLFDPDAASVMRQQAKLSPLVRGTRLQLHWHERPEFRFASTADRMHDEVFRKNIAVLSELDWVFELQVFAPQMADAAKFVAAFPDTTFVLVHAGMLESTELHQTAEWTAGMRMLADQPNVVVKLTGQGTFVHRVDRTLINFVTATCLDLFGPDRCMWGSNFPVEKIWTDLSSLVDAWRSALRSYPMSVQKKVLSDNAIRVYSL